MKTGIKVGPWPESISDLERTHAPYCEVWFNVNEPQPYEDLFRFLRISHIEAGLHFWGVLEDGITPNFAYPDTHVINESMVLFRKTIDLAAQNNCVYVNIHPGSRCLTRTNFVKKALVRISDPCGAHESEQLLLEYGKKLSEYATNRGLILTIETVPSREVQGWTIPNARLGILTDIYSQTPETLAKAGGLGLWIANDFSHTAGNFRSTHRDRIAKFTIETTKKLAPFTRLLHIGFIVPPYNGTDFHDHLDNPLFDTNQAIPNKQELIDLLGLFKNRPDIWAIVEPANDHPRNYFLLQEILARST